MTTTTVTPRDDTSPADLDPADFIARFSPPLPPRPGSRPFVGIVPDLMRDPYFSLWRLAREHGDVIRVPIPGIEMVLINHPDYVNHVFNKHAARYLHSHELLDAAFLPGEPRGLPLREGDDWKRVRRMLNPRFSESSLEALTPLIVGAIADEVAGWERYADSGETVELQHELAVLVMSGLVRSMFATPFEREWLEDFVEMCQVHGDFIAKAMLTFMVTRNLPLGTASVMRSERFPWPHLGAGRRNWDRVRAELTDLIGRRRSQPTPEHDLLNLLIEARFENGTALAGNELRSELMGLLFAGFETTAAALSWTIALLAQHPEHRDRAEAEVDALGDRPLSYDLIADAPFLRACFDEALRIQGAPMHLRWAKQDDVIGGYRIPAGTFVAIPMAGLHHDPRFWNEPQSFRPQRFLEEEINKYAFFPFGVGPRRCLGMRMAYIEGILALVAMLRSYRFDVPTDWAPERAFHVSTGLKDLPTRVSRR